MVALRLASISVMAGFISTTAMAQEVMGPVCTASAPSTASLTFDDSDHRRWHRRFWTGKAGTHRRINTRDLTEFYGILKDASDISLALGLVEGRTDRALNAD